MKVLIIDDCSDAQALARVLLAKEGLETLSASSGPQGLRLAETISPDLVLLDLEMPEMSGFDVCRALKAQAATCMVPVIFLTGSDNSGDKVRGLDLGAVDYVTKPFDAFELRARVRAALRTKHLQDLLVQHAHIDPLTELWNRRALIERLAQEWARLQRYGGALVLVMADVDHFKRINDTFGHPAGDQLLRAVAQTLASQCRQSDLAARYGGEEFAVLMPEASAEQGAGFAERCRRQIELTALTIDGQRLAVTASFGVADTAGITSEGDLLAAADQALYRAKHEGRNRIALARTALAEKV